MIAPAKTGSDNNNNIAVMKSAHTNKGNLCKVIPGALMLRTVVIKFIAPKIEDIPARCKLKIAKSTEAPECDCIPAKGGYHFIVVLCFDRVDNSVLSYRIGLYLYLQNQVIF